MIPHMKKNDIKLFYKYLDNAFNYLEYGSGGSTYQAAIRQNIKKVVSVESDKEWIETINSRLLEIPNKEKVIFYHVESLKTKPNTWGYPGKDCDAQDYKKYSDLPSPFEKRNDFDLIFIDGRFRVACCLKCFNMIGENAFIIFDDFLNRLHQFGVVLDFFEIVEKTQDNCMVVLSKKKNIKEDVLGSLEDFVKKYENIPE
jgi:hypothetical protein